MLEDFIIKETEAKGLGIFTTRDIKKGEHVFHTDLRNLRKYTVEEIDGNPELDGDHSDYIGHGLYAVDHSPSSYMNHSCDPNCYVKMKTIAVKDTYAFRDINAGEELTHDYTATSVSQFAGMGFWEDECKCGSANCRKVIHGDLFKLPLEVQRRYYPNLPLSIRRRYRDRLTELRRK